MLSSNVKYIGLDVHKEAIAVAVLNGAGKLVAESIVATKASTLLDFLDGQRVELHVTLKEGHGRRGCTTSSNPTCGRSWFAIRVATPY
jgi:hypothetical protein